MPVGPPCVSALESNGTKFFTPLPDEQKQLDDGDDPYAARHGETRLFTAYRQRMGTDEAKAMYRRRAAAAEFPNANCRNHGGVQNLKCRFSKDGSTVWFVQGLRTDFDRRNR